MNLPKSKILRAGQARNDLLSSTSVDLVSKVGHRGKKILYAPTWRPFSEVVFFPFKDLDIPHLITYLEKTNITIFLRLHPNFETHIDKTILNHRIKILSKQHVEDINDILSDFDLLITDYSSIYIDYLLTLRPLIFLPYDLKEYNKTIGLSIDYNTYTPGPKPETMQNFIYETHRLLHEPNYYNSERARVNELLNPISQRQAENNKNLVFSLI